ncbi:MAG TPA: enoyl-CoA hydratase/isomerase family protein [Solirubrobacterales bacterium]|nr:enoyl-CoA hydratase/isomerase family protein [Solirubrobacterales bacterium]
MSDRLVTVEPRGNVAVVRIDRPPANAMNPALLEEVIGVREELEADAVVLTGRDGFFSAGLDLNLVPTLDPAGQAEMIMAINRMVAAWYGFDRPVVGAVNGHAIAGGIVLAMCADYRVGSTQGKLGLTEARVGVPYPANALAVVTAELSPPAARYLVLRAHLVDPPEALALGLVDELAEPAEVLERALAMAAELGDMPSDAYATVKRQLRGPALAAMRQVVESGTDPLAQGWLSAETGSAATAAMDRKG